MKILVTGGGGYIGSILTSALLAESHEVTVIDNMWHGENSLALCCAYEGFRFVRGDVRDHSLFRPLVAHADLIIPLAALVGANACKQDEIGATSINRNVIIDLATYCGWDQGIIFPNTNSGYGNSGEDRELTEDDELKPLSLYGKLKCEAERHVMSRQNSIVFRLATVFGASPRMRTDLLVNDFVLRAVKDRSIVLFEPQFRRNFIHVRDVAGTFVHAIRNFALMKDKIYNCGDSRANLTKQQLAERIKSHVADLTILVADNATDPDKRDYVVSNARLEATGWSPKVSLDDGIKELRKLYWSLRVKRYANA